MSINQPHTNYPPSPPSSLSRPPRPPPLRVNTHNARSSNSSVRSAGHSPVKPGFSYNLPTSLDSPNHSQNRARPGGLAALASSTSAADVPTRVRSPPITPGSRSQSRPGHWSRRGSNDSNLPPPAVRPRSEPRPTSFAKDGGVQSGGVQSPPLASIYSGREGIGYNRVDGVSSPSPADLQLFAHHCRQFYFSATPPQESASYISTTLASLPPSHRAAYTRLQASLRSLAHLHHLRVRISSFHALISSTVASASLSPLARQELQGSQAKTERAERSASFISTWCTSNSGGVEPFFRGLWGTLRAQSRGDESRGGGGGNRIVWEIDDAVFLESGGTEFMHEAVTFLKGVLGFDDQPLTSPPKLRRIRTVPKSYLNSRPNRLVRQSTPSALEDPKEELANVPPVPNRKSDSRSRAISDPFIDRPRPTRRGPAPPPPPSRRHPGTIPNPLQASRSPPHGAAATRYSDSPLLTQEGEPETATDGVPRPPIPERISEDRIHLLSRRTLSEANEDRPVAFGNVTSDSVFEEDEDEPTEDDIAAEEVDLNKPRFRLWVFPSFIDDQEAERLMALFPRFIAKKSDVRFPLVRPGRGVKSMEEACWEAIAVGTADFTESESKVVRVPKVEVEDQEGVVRYGTGRMWVGTEPRRARWQGSGWFRFKRWWRRLFGMG